MKESITKFDLEAAFKALDEIEVPVTTGIKANRAALSEIFSRKSKFDALMEEYYDVSNTEELDSAKESREAEVAKAKLARIEKIVDLDAESPDELLTSYVGKYIMQCPQCMTLFYKNKEDIVESEDDPNTVNVNEVCQHCGNESGYTLVGKVGEATEEEVSEYTGEETVDVTSTEEDENLDLDLALDADETGDEGSSEDEDLDLSSELDALDLTDEAEEETEEEEEDTQEESYFDEHSGDQLLEALTEETDLDISDAEFEELINSPEFKKPISDNATQAMLDANEENQEAQEESCDNTEVEAEPLTEAGVKDLFKAVGAGIGNAVKAVKNASEITIDALASVLKSRAQKADWVLKNALVDYNNAEFEDNGKIVVQDDDRKFEKFLVIGFDAKNSHKQLIKQEQKPTTKGLVAKQKGKYFDNFEAAENEAKGWSLIDENGPAFVYMSTGTDDLIFVCEYFKGRLEYDQVPEYFKSVKASWDGAWKRKKASMSADKSANNSKAARAPLTPSYESLEQQDELQAIMEQLDELHTETLEKYIAESLIESYKNVVSYKLNNCNYTDGKLLVEGTVHFASGNTRDITYSFTSGQRISNEKVVLQGLNEKLGTDSKFILTGCVNRDKSLITESFKRNKTN